MVRVEDIEHLLCVGHHAELFSQPLNYLTSSVMSELFYSVLYNMVPPAHMWLLSPCSGSGVTEELNDRSYLIAGSVHLNLNG